LTKNQKEKQRKKARKARQAQETETSFEEELQWCIDQIQHGIDSNKLAKIQCIFINCKKN